MRKKVDEDLSKRFENTCQFCDEGINKFCLILQKVVYSYESRDVWERFNETSWGIDTPYEHAKKSQEILWNAKSGQILRPVCT